MRQKPKWYYNTGDEYSQNPYYEYDPDPMLDIKTYKEKIMPKVDHTTEPGWPKKYIIRAHSNRETNRMLGEYLGLEDTPLHRLKNAFTEVLFYVSIAEDGSVAVDRVVSTNVDTVMVAGEPNWHSYQEYRG